MSDIPALLAAAKKIILVKVQMGQAAKNIVVPAPNPDGRWFNGRIDRVAQEIAERAEFTTS